MTHYIKYLLVLNKAQLGFTMFVLIRLEPNNNVIYSYTIISN